MVPLSPWLNVLIVLMLILATYAFLRQRAGRGLMLLAGTLLVGGMVMHADKSAFSTIGPTSTIATASGSMTLYCTQTHYLGTTVPGGVRLTVTPVNQPDSIQGAITPSAPSILECTTGTYLNPGALCALCVER